MSTCGYRLNNFQKMRGGKILKDECGILKISSLRRDIAAKITEKSRVTHFDFLSVACGKAPTRLLFPPPASREIRIFRMYILALCRNGANIT